MITLETGAGMEHNLCNFCGTFLHDSPDTYKKICPKYLPDQLKSIVSQWKQLDPKRHYTMLNLSSAMPYYTSICPYTPDGKWRCYESYCAVCGHETEYGGPMMYRRVPLTYNGVQLDYYRCENCHKKNKYLCEISLQDTEYCSSNIKDQIDALYCYLVCIQKRLKVQIPLNIKKLLLKYIINLNVCLH